MDYSYVVFVVGLAISFAWSIYLIRKYTRLLKKLYKLRENDRDVSEGYANLVITLHSYINSSPQFNLDPESEKIAIELLDKIAEGMKYSINMQTQIYPELQREGILKVLKVKKVATVENKSGKL